MTNPNACTQISLPVKKKEYLYIVYNKKRNLTAGFSACGGLLSQ